VPKAVAAQETRQDQREKLKAEWSVCAPGWDKGYDWYISNFRPLMEWCCDITMMSPGARVLDIATGTGQPAFSAADRVKPTGSVVATDISPDMLQSAKRRARMMGVDNIEFGEMDAQELTFGDAAFDVVTFTFGLMFCHDPVKAVAEIRRVLRPGGRFAIVVWDESSKNPFLSLLGKCFAEVIPSPPPDPRAPGAFRLAQREDLARVLREGGFSDFEIESRPLTVEYASIEVYMAISVDLRGGLKTKLDALAKADRDRLDRLVHATMAPFLRDGVLRLTATPLCAWGRA
jgi:SAM-dependent methyltransferase